MGQPAMSQIIEEVDDSVTRSFASCLKHVRIRLAGKQAWLSREIGCSDAAISFWESGGRLPNQQNLCRILVAMARSGATTSELLALRGSWHQAMTKRTTGRIDSFR
jgi:DNA-binding transcriptional regulator YiaG